MTVHLRINRASGASFANGLTVTKNYDDEAANVGRMGGFTAASHAGLANGFRSSWGSFQFGGVPLWLHENALRGANGLSTTQLTGKPGRSFKATVGWPTEGILVMEMLIPSDRAEQAAFQWGGLLDTNGGIGKGTIAKDITVAGQAVRLHTYWTNQSGLNVFSGNLQVTRTVIPMQLSDASAASPVSHTVTVGNPAPQTEVGTSPAYSVGLTAVIQFGAATVDAVQTWIANSLVLETPRPDFSERIAVVCAPPLVARLPWDGLGRVAGDVAVDGSPDLPVRRRVRLIRERDGVCVGEAWSDPVTGAYDFQGIDPRERYTVIAYDGPRVYAAAVQDNVQPTPWP